MRYFLFALWLGNTALAATCDPERTRFLTPLERALCASFQADATPDEFTLETLAHQITRATGLYVHLDATSLTSNGKGSETLLFPDSEPRPLHEFLSLFLGEQGVQFSATDHSLVFHCDEYRAYPRIYAYSPQIFEAEQIPDLLQAINLQRGLSGNLQQHFVSSQPAVFSVNAPWELHWQLKTESGIMPILPPPDTRAKDEMPLLARRIEIPFEALDMQLGDFLPHLSQALVQSGYPGFRHRLDMAALNAEGRGSESILNVHLPALGAHSLTLAELSELFFGPMGLAALDFEGGLYVTTPSAAERLLERRDFSAPTNLHARTLFNIFRNTVFPESWAAEEIRTPSDVASKTDAFIRKTQERAEEIRRKAESGEYLTDEQYEAAISSATAELHAFQMEQLANQAAMLQRLRTDDFTYLNFGSGVIVQKHKGQPHFAVVNSPPVLNCVEELLRGDFSQIR